MSLRTLHITNAWHASSGGISTFYKALLRSANDIGWHARLVVPGDSSGFERIGQFGGIYTIAAPLAPMNQEYRILYPDTFLGRESAMQNILRHEQPDVVEICDKYTLPYLGGLLRIGYMDGQIPRPVVVNLSCERLDETVCAYSLRPRLATLFARSYMKWIYFPLADHHIAVSGHTALELETASKGHKVRRGVWIRGMGVDVERFVPARRNHAFRSRLLQRVKGGPDTTLLLYAGRLAPEKNLGLLLATLNHLSSDVGDFRLLVAGDGLQREEFLAAAHSQHSNKVIYLGHQTNKEALANLYANADIFIHPNPKEPFGIAPLEAMASGLPLVAPDSGGVSVYAHRSNAWLSEPSPEGFAASIREILEDPEERRLRTQRARRTAEQFSWPGVCARFFGLYGDLKTAHLRPDKSPNEAPAFYSTYGNWFGFESQNNTY